MINAIELIKARISDLASTPENRSDPYKLALIGCTGAMAGVNGAGFVARLEAHNLLRIFDLSVASSAGALVNSYFLAKKAILGSHAIPTFLSDRGFNNDGKSRLYVDKKRILKMSKGEHIWDIGIFLDGIMNEKCPLAPSDIIASGIPHYTVASTIRGEPIIIPLVSERSDALRSALFSSCRIPFIIDNIYHDTFPSVLNLWDGGLASATPVIQAINSGATHCFVLRNFAPKRKTDVTTRLATSIISWIIKRKNPLLASTFDWSQSPSKNIDMFEGRNDVFVVSPPIEVGLLQTEQVLLWRAMIAAYRHIGIILGLPDADIPTLWREQIERDGLEERVAAFCR